MKLSLSAAAIAFSLTLAALTPVQAQDNWTASGFNWPESTVWDKNTGNYILSNINGHPAEADGKGYLSLLNTDGKVIKQKWVDDLDAPKGMALVGDELLVADLKHLHVIDMKSGKKKTSILVPEATLLNDVTSDGKSAWVSDWMGHGIWRYENGKMTLWYKDEAIRYPNGLLVEDGKLLVGTWGDDLQDDFSTKIPGDLKVISLKDKKASVLAKGVGNLDGVIRFKGRLMTNDWITGKIYEILPSGEAKEIMSLPKGLADISHDDTALLLPFMLDGKLERRELK